MIRSFNIIFFLMTLVFSSLKAQESKVIDKVIGVVGEHPVLLSEVEMQYQQLLSSGEIEEDYRCEIFDQLMLEKLFLKQAEMDSVTVSQDEVDSELDRRIRYFTSLFGSSDKLEEYYGKSILEIKGEFEEDIYKQLLADRLRGSIFAGMQVTPSEVKEFYASVPEDSLPFFNAEVELAHIVLYPQVSDPQKQYAREKINGIREDLINEADFCLKALINSDDPGSKESCGDLGFIRRGEMVPEFEAAAFRLSEGQLSDIVETEYGFHLIQCLERKGERSHVRHILIAPKITKVEVYHAEQKMDSILELLNTEVVDWNTAVALFSEDEATLKTAGRVINPNSGTASFDMDELEPDLAFIIEKMQVGEISDIVPYLTETGKQGMRVVKLISEVAPHRASLKQDYAKIMTAAKQAKQQEKLDSWVEEKSKQTYIFVDPYFSDCKRADKWKK